MTDGCCAIACETGESIYRDDFCVHLIIEAANEYCRSSLFPTALNGNYELFSTVFYRDKKKDVVDVHRNVVFTKLRYLLPVSIRRMFSVRDV